MRRRDLAASGDVLISGEAQRGRGCPGSLPENGPWLPFDKCIIDAIIPISLVAPLILTVIAMLLGSHPSDWDPWVLSTINAPLPELIDGDRLASLIAAAEDAVPSCILDSFFLEVPPEAALRFLAARGIAIEAAKAAFQAACAPFLPPGSRARRRWEML